MATGGAGARRGSSCGGDVVAAVGVGGRRLPESRRRRRRWGKSLWRRPGHRDGRELLASLGDRRTVFLTWRWHFAVITCCSAVDCSANRQNRCSAIFTDKSSSFADLTPRSSSVRRCSEVLRLEAGSQDVAEHALSYNKRWYVRLGQKNMYIFFLRSNYCLNSTCFRRK